MILLVVQGNVCEQNTVCSKNNCTWADPCILMIINKDLRLHFVVFYLWYAHSVAKVTKTWNKSFWIKTFYSTRNPKCPTCRGHISRSKVSVCQKFITRGILGINQITLLSSLFSAMKWFGIYCSCCIKDSDRITWFNFLVCGNGAERLNYSSIVLCVFRWLSL